jgi:hypothetical protein
MPGASIALQARSGVAIRAAPATPVSSLSPLRRLRPTNRVTAWTRPSRRCVTCSIMTSYNRKTCSIASGLSTSFPAYMPNSVGLTHDVRHRDAIAGNHQHAGEATRWSSNRGEPRQPGSGHARATCNSGADVEDADSTEDTSQAEGCLSSQSCLYGARLLATCSAATSVISAPDSGDCDVTTRALPSKSTRRCLCTQATPSCS